VDTGFPIRKSFQSVSMLMWGQIIEELYANIPHTVRDDNCRAQIFRQKTVLFSRPSLILSNSPALAHTFAHSL
jgi:hypothetical protein